MDSHEDHPPRSRRRQHPRRCRSSHGLPPQRDSGVGPRPLRAFGDGAQARVALAGFARAAAGASFASSAWTWGLASESLTNAYDPDGVPDAYSLLDAQGEVTYQNSVPVSTMGDLLSHLTTS